jgi:hypothetical protein|tara:strand:+ start:4124 stop:4279 length:156 start_codon:yes stop_codon:yes gene_type:complete
MPRIGFKKLVSNLERKGKSKESAQKIAAFIGRKKYGKSKMSKMAAAGRRKR